MRLINDCNIPYPIFVAMCNDMYSGRGYDFSASNVFDDPRPYWGTKQIYASGVELSAYDEQVMFLGTMIHDGLEHRLSIPSSNQLIDEVIVRLLEMDDTFEPERVKGLISFLESQRAVPKISTDDFVTEKRMCSWIKNDKGETYSISGQIDLYSISRNTIYDYKTMLGAGWKMRKRHMDEWSRKLNFYRMLMQVTENIEVTGLSILPIITDWREMKCIQDGQFPRLMFERELHMDLIPIEDVKADVHKRVDFITSFKDKPISEMPYCTPENRWQNETTYKIYKDGAKRACTGGTFVDDPEGAAAFLIEKGPGHNIKKILSEPMRCQKYCRLAKLGLCDFADKWAKEHSKQDE